MGRKKLSTVRRELEQALAATGKGPFRWLDDRIRELAPAGSAKPRSRRTAIKGTRLSAISPWR